MNPAGEGSESVLELVLESSTRSHAKIIITSEYTVYKHTRACAHVQNTTLSSQRGSSTPMGGMDKLIHSQPAAVDKPKFNSIARRHPNPDNQGKAATPPTNTFMHAAHPLLSCMRAPPRHPNGHHGFVSGHDIIISYHTQNKPHPPVVSKRMRAQWRAIKGAATQTMVAHGATCTHHHAVGKLHRCAASKDALCVCPLGCPAPQHSSGVHEAAY